MYDFASQEYVTRCCSTLSYGLNGTHVCFQAGFDAGERDIMGLSIEGSA
jgi:hypothetical protein